MNRWDWPGVPHKGWECVSVYDLKEVAPEAERTCEMCGRSQLRYVHVMEHPEHDPLEVGCVCAGKTAAGYDAHRAEAALKNQQKRRARFRRGWKTTETGDRRRRKNGVPVTIGQDSRGGYWVRAGDECLPGCPKTFLEACDAAFDALDTRRPPPRSAAVTQHPADGRPSTR